MNIYNSDFIGATGRYGIFEHVDDTSNIISTRITNTSNDLAMNINNTSNYIKITSNLLHQEIQYTSNENYKYSSNETHEYYHNNYGPFDGYPYVLGSMPPAMQPIPTNAGAIEAFSLTTQFRRANLKSVYFDELQDKSIKGHIDLIEEILQNNEIRTNLNEIQSLAWQAVSMNNKIQSSANSTTITGMQTEITAISKVLALTASATAFNTLYSIGDFIGNAITFFSTNNDGDLTELKTFNEYLFYTFHREPTSNTILESITVNQDLNGKINNPNGEIVRGTGTVHPYLYDYNLSATNNYIDVLTSNNAKIKEYLLNFETSFSLSFKIVFKSSASQSFLLIGNTSNTYLKLYFDGTLSTLYFMIYDSTGALITQQSQAISITLNTRYHIVFAHGKTTGLDIYLDKVKIKSGSYNLTTTPTNWNNINSTTLKFRVMENAKNIKIEDYRIIPTKISANDVVILFDTYGKVLTLEDTLRAEIIYSSNEILKNASNYVLGTSNIRSTNINNTSKWIRSSSNQISANIQNTSNILATNINNTSNWIGSCSNQISANIQNTSNILATNINNTSNWIKNFDTNINTKTNGLWLNDGLNVYNFNSNIGIGTSTTNYKLQVVGDTSINSNLYVDGLTQSGTLQVLKPINYFDYTGFINKYSINGYNILYYQPNSTCLYEKVGNNSTLLLNSPAIKWDTSTNKYKINYAFGYSTKIIDRALPQQFNNFTMGISLKFSSAVQVITVADIYTKSVVNPFLTILVETINNIFLQGKVLRFILRVSTSPTSGYYDIDMGTTDYIINTNKEYFVLFSFRTDTIAFQSKGSYKLFVNNVLLSDTFQTLSLLDVRMHEIWIGNNSILFSYADIILITELFITTSLYKKLSTKIYDALISQNTYPTSVLLGTTFIENLNYGNIHLPDGKKHITNDKTNYNTSTPQVNSITVQDEGTRRSFYIDTVSVNGTNNLKNETGNSGFIYYADGNSTTTAQVKSISYTELTNKPTLFDGNYNSLTNKRTLFDGNYNSLTNKPNIEAISGNITTSSNLNTSNYVLNTSNVISNRISGLNNVSLATIVNITNASNLNTSNYVLNTSNVISNRISGLNNVSLETIGNVANASNLNTSNYVVNTQNNLTTLINTTQNTLTAGTNINIVGNTISATGTSLETIGNIASASNLNTSNYVLNTQTNLTVPEH